jgi:nicotinamidase-related amidase
VISLDKASTGLAGRLVSTEDSVLVVIDVQEGFVTDTADAQRTGLLERIRPLGTHAEWAGIPVLATVEMPQRWGTFHPLLESAFPDIPVLVKGVFGLADDDAVFPAVEATDRRTVVLVGLQTDVCVAQSAIGLRRKGYEVVCIVDAVGSVHAVAHEAGLERMRSAGVVMLCARQLHAEWARTVANSEQYSHAHPDPVPGI